MKKNNLFRYIKKISEEKNYLNKLKNENEILKNENEILNNENEIFNNENTNLNNKLNISLIKNVMIKKFEKTSKRPNLNINRIKESEFEEPRSEFIKKKFPEKKSPDLKTIEESEDEIPIPPIRRKKKLKMIETYENNIIENNQPIIQENPKRIFKKLASALKNYTRSYKVSLLSNDDVLFELIDSENTIHDLLKKELDEFKAIKFIQTLKVIFEKIIEKFSFKTGHFNSKPKILMNENEIPKIQKESQDEIINKIQEWVSEGSGWTIYSISSHHFNFINYQPLNGSSYIDLPTELINSSKGLINIINEDDKCFLYCHLYHLHKKEIIKNPQRVSKYKQYVNEVDYSKIKFPVEQNQYNKIEKLNNININVFGYENKQTFPIYISKEKFDNNMNLLLINDNNKNHYVYIKDFNRFMYNQSKHHGKKHFCMYCLQCFTSQKILINHQSICISINGKQSIKMPEENSKVYFKHYYKQLPLPFVIYADFESILEKIDTVTPSTDNYFTEAYQKHSICSYGCKVMLL